MSRFARAALVAGLIVGVASAQEARLTRAELERRWQGGIAVEFRDTPLPEVIAELERRAGIRIVPDALVAERIAASTRGVTHVMKRTSARAVLVGALLQPREVEAVIDEELGGVRLRALPEAPSVWALREVVGPVSWSQKPVAEALAELERAAKLSLEVAPEVRPYLEGRRVDLVRRTAMAGDLLGPLLALGPIRAEPRPDRRVALVLATLGPAEMEAALARSVLIRLPDRATLGDAAGLIRSMTGAYVSCPPELAGRPVQGPRTATTLRALLGDLTRQAGATWRVEDGMVVLRAR